MWFYLNGLPLSACYINTIISILIFSAYHKDAYEIWGEIYNTLLNFISSLSPPMKIYYYYLCCINICTWKTRIKLHMGIRTYCMCKIHIPAFWKNVRQWTWFFCYANNPHPQFQFRTEVFSFCLSVSDDTVNFRTGRVTE